MRASDFTDVNGWLARWRLRLIEFEFNVTYRRGEYNLISDAISSLPTYGYTKAAPDLNIRDTFCNKISRKIFAAAQILLDTSSWC